MSRLSLGSPHGSCHRRTQRPNLLQPTRVVCCPQSTYRALLPGHGPEQKRQLLPRFHVPACNGQLLLPGVSQPHALRWQLLLRLFIPRSLSLQAATNQTSSTLRHSQLLWLGLSSLATSVVLPDHRCCQTREPCTREVQPVVKFTNLNSMKSFQI